MTTQKTSARNPRTGNIPQLIKKLPGNTKSGRWLWFWIGMSGIAMASATAGALLAVSLSSTPLMQTRLSPEEAAVFDSDRIAGTGLRFSELTRPVNILVMGMSVLPQDVQNPPEAVTRKSYQPQLNSFDGLADVMLLMRFDPENKKLAMLSIPRDTRVEIEGHGLKKVNSANIHGGPALTAKTVSNLTGGVGIDRFVRINVLGVAKLIDALGGVTVYVPKDMKYVDQTQHLYIDLKAGKQHLNGDQALQLLRYRQDENGDIGRIQRQQMVMRALMEQTLNPATAGRLPKILSVVQSHIDTNLTVEELVALVGFGVRTNRSNMQMLMLPGTFSEKGQYNASYWLPDSDRINGIMAKHFSLENAHSGESINKEKLSVAVQDSTGNPRAIRALLRNLREAGYQNVYVSRPWNEPLDVTHIVAQTGDGESAEAIRNALDLGEVRVESTGNLQSDITIQVGKDWADRQGQ